MSEDGRVNRSKVFQSKYPLLLGSPEEVAERIMSGEAQIGEQFSSFLDDNTKRGEVARLENILDIYAQKSVENTMDELKKSSITKSPEEIFVIALNAYKSRFDFPQVIINGERVIAAFAKAFLEKGPALFVFTDEIKKLNELGLNQEQIEQYKMEQERIEQIIFSLIYLKPVRDKKRWGNKQKDFTTGLLDLGDVIKQGRTKKEEIKELQNALGKIFNTWEALPKLPRAPRENFSPEPENTPSTKKLNK